MDVDQELIGFQRGQFLLDILRRILIIWMWSGIFFLLLTTTSWVWAVVWLLPGLILSKIILGFLTLPLYIMLGLLPGVRRTKKRLFSD